MMLLWLLACGEEEVPCPDTPTYENWAEGFFISKCQPCHAPDARNIFGAPAIEMNTHEEILDLLDVIHDSVLVGERMPPGGGLSDDDRILLQSWLDCPQ